MHKFLYLLHIQKVIEKEKSVYFSIFPVAYIILSLRHLGRALFDGTKNFVQLFIYVYSLQQNLRDESNK